MPSFNDRKHLINFIISVSRVAPFSFILQIANFFIEYSVIDLSHGFMNYSQSLLLI